MTLYLNQEFDALWQGKDPFAEVDLIQGKVYRQLEGRRTLRFEVAGKGYFLKSHKGVGWREIIKNLLQFRLPILGAANEKNAILKLEEAGVATMSMAAYGSRGLNPARQESFIVTEAIEPSISLEDLAIEWRSKPPTAMEKRKFLMAVCDMTRRMHETGVNHRDFYICHFLFSPAEGSLISPAEGSLFSPAEGSLIDQAEGAEPLDLKLIDLHRALIHADMPFRWRLKDLASLYYSAFDVPLTKRDKLRFIKHYSGLPLREALQQDAVLWKKVRKKAKKLYKKALRKGIVR